MFKIISKKRLNYMERELADLRSTKTPSYSTKLEPFVLDSCNCVTYNLNDVFSPGGADSEEIDSGDLEQMLPLMEIYGSDVVALAYCCLVRGSLPLNPKVVAMVGGERNLKRVIKELVKIAKKDEYFLDDHQVDLKFMRCYETS